LVTMSFNDWLELYEKAYGKPALDMDVIKAIGKAAEETEK